MTVRPSWVWGIKLLGGIVVVVILVVCVTITNTADGSLGRARQRITSYQTALANSQGQTSRAQNAATQDRAIIVAQQAALAKLESAYEAAVGHPSGVTLPAVPPATSATTPTTATPSTPPTTTRSTTGPVRTSTGTTAGTTPTAQPPTIVVNPPATAPTTAPSTTTTTAPSGVVSRLLGGLGSLVGGFGL